MADATEDRLAVIEDDFRAGQGCSDAVGLALVAEVRRFREEVAQLQGRLRFLQDKLALAREETDEIVWNFAFGHIGEDALGDA